MDVRPHNANYHVHTIKVILIFLYHFKTDRPLIHHFPSTFIMIMTLMGLCVVASMFSKVNSLVYLNGTTVIHDFWQEGSKMSRMIKTNPSGTLNVYHSVNPLGDKVSILTHIYPHKARRKIEVTICKITRLTAHFMCGLMSDLLICTCL